MHKIHEVEILMLRTGPRFNGQAESLGAYIAVTFGTDTNDVTVYAYTSCINWFGTEPYTVWRLLHRAAWKATRLWPAYWFELHQDNEHDPCYDCERERRVNEYALAKEGIKA